MEYMAGGELFDAVIKNVYFSENKARDIIKTLLSDVYYLHSCHIVRSYVYMRVYILIYIYVCVCMSEMV